MEPLVYGAGRVILVALSFLTCGAVGASPTPQVAAVAVKTETPPVIDGVLDDAAWALARPFDDFTQADPVAGAAPGERTEVRVVYDSRNLYIGVRCEGGPVLARQTRRDQSNQGDDSVIITLDTNLDGRTGFFFEVSAAGARTDGLIDNDSSLGTNWDGIWEARTSVDDQGWSAEIRIPLATITFDGGLTAWGLNVERFIGRTREKIRWRNWRREGSPFQVSGVGELTDLEGLSQGMGLTIKPFISAKYDGKGGGLDIEPGVDLFYKITPQITLALTINTDFAETEVDDRVVNLSRFPTFFPERRDFFLEDAGIFDFGGVRQSPRPFFSRRIGIVRGEEKGILAGARLTGRHGALRFGMMTVQMDPDDELGEKNLSVIRLQHDVLEESSVGMIFTNGDPARRGENTLFGVDFNYRNSNAFDGAGRVSADVFAQGTYTDSVGVDNDNSDTTSIGGRFNVDYDPWDFRGFFARIGEDYDPGLGFVSRRGRYEHNYGGGYTFRFSEERSRVRDVRFSTNLNLFTTLDSVVDTLDVHLPDVQVNLHTGDSFGGRFFVSRDNLTDPFTIVDGVTLPVGTYDNVGGEIRAASSSARPIAVDGAIRRLGFYDGDRWDYTAGVTFRPGSAFSASAEYTINEIDLPEGSFIVRLFTMRATVQFTPDLSWDNTIQWDNQSDELGLNSRVRWEFRPGQELFVVYNEGFAVDDGSFSSERQAMTVKLGLAFQF